MISDIQFRLTNQQKQASVVLKKKLEEDLETQLNKISKLLQSSHKTSILSFYYQSQQDLFKAQDVLAILGQHLLQTADDLDDSFREQSYYILKLLISRGELDLNQVGFTEQTEETDHRLYKYKLQVSLNYQRFMYEALDKTLKKITQKAVGENEK